MKTRRLRCLATGAAAKTGKLDRGARADARASGTTQHSSKRCAAAWHFMVTRALTVHAASLAHGVPDRNAGLDRLNTARCAEFYREARAAETKRAFTFYCVAHDGWHEDRRSNARVERPRDGRGCAPRAHNKLGRSRRAHDDVWRTARTRS